MTVPVSRHIFSVSLRQLFLRISPFDAPVTASGTSYLQYGTGCFVKELLLYTDMII